MATEENPMTPIRALRVLTSTLHPRQNLPEQEEALEVLLGLIQTIPAHTMHLIDLHNRISELESQVQALMKGDETPDHV